MKYFVLLTFILFSNLVFANWNLKRDYEDTLLYMSPNSTRLALSFRTTESKKKKFSQELLDELKEDKQKMLSMIGVNEWEMTKSDVQTNGDVTNIVLEGSYLDTAGNTTHFVEYHFYAPTKKLQLLLTNESSAKLKLDAKESKIAEFKTKHGF